MILWRPLFDYSLCRHSWVHQTISLMNVHYYDKISHHQQPTLGQTIYHITKYTRPTQGNECHKYRFNAVLQYQNTHENTLGRQNKTKNKYKATQVKKRKNTNTHHFWINCGNKGATSCGQTNPRRPIVIAKNTLIDRERNKFMQSEQLKRTNMAQSLR